MIHETELPFAKNIERFQRLGQTDRHFELCNGLSAGCVGLAIKQPFACGFGPAFIKDRRTKQGGHRWPEFGFRTQPRRCALRKTKKGHHAHREPIFPGQSEQAVVQGQVIGFDDFHEEESCSRRIGRKIGFSKMGFSELFGVLGLAKLDHCSFHC